MECRLVEGGASMAKAERGVIHKSESMREASPLLPTLYLSLITKSPELDYKQL